MLERKLLNYLPYAVREYKEFQGITGSEQPEFELVWDAQEEAFNNQLIDTAGDYGLSRWEKILKITPKGSDTLESRRAKIKTQLNNFVPYTFKVLVRMIKALGVDEPFTVTLEPGTYFLSIVTQRGVRGKIEGLGSMLENIVPSNIYIQTINVVPCEAEGLALACGGVCYL